MGVTGNIAERVRRYRAKKADQGLERVEAFLSREVLEGLREESRYQQVPLHTVIEAVLADHLRKERRIWV